MRLSISSDNGFGGPTFAPDRALAASTAFIILSVLLVAMTASF
jgi:hypothetical protein